MSPQVVNRTVPVNSLPQNHEPLLERASPALVESCAVQNRYRRLVELSPDGFFDWDLSSASTWFSPQVESLLPRPVEGRPRGFARFSELVIPEDRARLLLAIREEETLPGEDLRAVAVLSVLFFHAGLPPFSGGFVGVDIFFVISGYLITGIILADISKPIQRRAFLRAPHPPHLSRALSHSRLDRCRRLGLVHRSRSRALLRVVGVACRLRVELLLRRQQRLFRCGCRPERDPSNLVARHRRAVLIVFPLLLAMLHKQLHNPHQWLVHI